MQDDIIHIPEAEPQTETTPDRVPGLGETEILPGGGIAGHAAGQRHG